MGGRTENAINDQPQKILYDPPFSASPLVLADMQTARGDNTATLAIHASSPTGLEMYVEEETSLDKETSHTTEGAGYIALSVE